MSNEKHKVLECLNRGCHPNKQWGVHDPLIGAVEIKNLEIVQLLLEGGADPNIGDSCGHTPLFATIMNEDQQILDFLLENGADPNKEARRRLLTSQLIQKDIEEFTELGKEKTFTCSKCNKETGLKCWSTIKIYGEKQILADCNHCDEETIFCFENINPIQIRILQSLLMYGATYHEKEIPRIKRFLGVHPEIYISRSLVEIYATSIGPLMADLSLPKELMAYILYFSYKLYKKNLVNLLKNKKRC